MSAPNTESLVDSTPHVQGSSANTATPATVGTPKASTGAQKASAVYLSARTNNAYVTFDGSVPTAANGLEVVAGAQPVRLPLPPESVDIKFCSANAAAASILNALFVA